MFSVRLYRIGPYAQRLYTLAPLKTVLRRDRRKNAIQKPNQTQPKTNDEEKGTRNNKNQRKNESEYRTETSRRNTEEKKTHRQRAEKHNEYQI